MSYVFHSLGPTTENPSHLRPLAWSSKQQDEAALADLNDFNGFKRSEM